MKRFLPLAAIEVVVWALLLLVTLLISRVAFEIFIGTGSLFDRIITQIARLSVSSIVVVVWLYAWKRITEAYFWRAINRRETTSRRSSGGLPAEDPPCSLAILTISRGRVRENQDSWKLRRLVEQSVPGHVTDPPVRS